MRVMFAVSCLLSLGCLAATGAVPVQAGGAQRCESTPQDSAPKRASSLVPHAHSGNVYGVPIQPKIFSRVKRKPHKPTAPPA